MSGHVGNLSPEQELALKEMKEAMADVHKPDYDDYYYLRFLRARSFNKAQAETMMRKSLTWRKRFAVDTILTDYTPPEALDKCYPVGYLGYDNEGCPIIYYAFKDLDYAGLLRCVGKNDILKYIAYMAERCLDMMKQESRRRGKVIESQVIIFDGSGYGFKRATSLLYIDMLSSIFRINETNYPEMLKACVCINAPPFFPVLFNLAKQFLADATMQKVVIFGKNGYQDYFREFIDADVLPTFLGGNRTDSDGNPLCLKSINFGSLVPDYYYYSEEYDNLKTGEDACYVTISKRSFCLVTVNVDEVGTRLCWNIRTESGDIGIGLYFKDFFNNGTQDTLVEILPVERTICYNVPENFIYTCEKPGTYVLKLDNSYSWFYHKKVYYTLTAKCPGKIENGLTRKFQNASISVASEVVVK